MLSPIPQGWTQARVIVQPVMKPFRRLGKCPQGHQQKRSRWQSRHDDTNDTQRHGDPAQRQQKWPRKPTCRGNIFICGIVVHENMTIFGVWDE